METCAGLQDSGTEDESANGNIEADLAPSELIDQHESTDDDESVGTLVHLIAEQAEALPVDLLEQADAAGRRPMNRPRVTARIVRTEDGETYHEYEVCGAVYGSLDAVNAAPDAR